MATGFSNIYIVLDDLDEYPVDDRDQLLELLLQIGNNISLMVTCCQRRGSRGVNVGVKITPRLGLQQAARRSHGLRGDKQRPGRVRRRGEYLTRSNLKYSVPRAVLIYLLSFRDAIEPGSNGG